MPEMNWGMVDNGGAFESLIHAILYAEDSSAHLLGRPGRDGGQDARTENGTHVYQAKYRKGMTMGKAIQLAKDELAKIAVYRAPGHANERHWASVTKWTLAANFQINHNDLAGWETEVVPAFRKIGIHADYWSLEKIENLLIAHPEIRDVFFNGNNRTLLEAGEAFRWLSRTSPGPSFLTCPLVGREKNLQAVESFLAASDKSLLTVTGPHGVGKSRFLYDAMLATGENGWRVFWGLPASMKKGSDWFRLLNSSWKTCVFVDEVDSGELLRRILEQTGASERRSWKFVVSVQPECLRLLPEIGMDITELEALSPKESQILSANCLPGMASLIKEEQAYRLFSLTQGLPAWLCLLLEEAKERSQFILPENLPGLVERRIDTALESLPPDIRTPAKTMLRWFSAWGTVKLEKPDADEFEFLSEKGIPGNQMENILSELVKCRLVSKWGIQQRLHAVEPSIVRQQILCSWLLEQTDSPRQYAISRNGQAFIGELLRFRVPNLPFILQNVCRMAFSYLPRQDSKRLLRPLFDELEHIAAGNSLRNQYHVLELLKHIGHADPDAALDILRTLRIHALPDEILETAFWGPSTLTHNALLTSVAEYLFAVAKYITKDDIPQRFLDEINEYLLAEENKSVKFIGGQEPSHCFQRLLGDGHCGHLYMPLAAKQLDARWDELPGNFFLQTVLKTIWDPFRETITCRGQRVAFQRYHVVHASNPAWSALLKFRQRAFSSLRDPNGDAALRREIWRQLRHSISRLDSMMAMDKDASPGSELMLGQIRSDLQNTLGVLDCPHCSLPELAEARQTWEPFLGENEPEALSDLAGQCEAKFRKRVKWPVQKVFSADLLLDESPVAIVLRQLRRENSETAWKSFFETAEQYLGAVAENERTSIVSNAAYMLVEQYCLDETISNNLASADFVREILSKPKPSAFERVFATALGKCCLRYAKRKDSPFSAESVLDPFLGSCPWKTELLEDLFRWPHPQSLGPLTPSEFRYLSSPENMLSSRQQATLLPPFLPIEPEQTKTILSRILADAPPLSHEQNNLMWVIIQSLHMAGLRYGWKSSQIPMDWVMDTIVRLKLDANIFDSSQMRWMRNATDWKFNMAQFTAFVQTRIALEEQKKPYEAFSVFPYHFEADKWCTIGPGESEQAAFNAFCGLIVDGETCTALLSCPEVLPRLDEDGCHISDFATAYFSAHASIDKDRLYRLGGLIAHYDENSPGWRAVATEICKRAIPFSRKEQFKIFRGFKPRFSVTGGTTEEIYRELMKQNQRALFLYDSEPTESPLKAYYSWSWEQAREELKLAQEDEEEEKHGEF